LTDDLVKRLRGFEGWDVSGGPNFGICEEAASRIEQLEKGFCDITDLDDPMAMFLIATACLTGKIDAQGKYCYVPYSVLEKKKNDIQLNALGETTDD
jgi:hypothetical protein